MRSFVQTEAFRGFISQLRDDVLMKSHKWPIPWLLMCQLTGCNNWQLRWIQEGKRQRLSGHLGGAGLLSAGSYLASSAFSSWGRRRSCAVTYSSSMRR
jgi:hypothetical protein